MGNYKTGTGKSKRNRRRQSAWSRYWPLLVAAGGLLLVLGAIWATRGGNTAGRAPVEVAGAPSLKVDQDRIELGDIRLGQWVTTSFKLTNIGDQPLRFTDQPFIEVAAGC
jgi:hypothetical protein